MQPTLNSPQSSIPAADSGSLQNKVADLEAEIRQLREQLGKAKHINDTMWETIVQKMVSESKGKATSKTGAAANGDFVSLDQSEETAGEANEGKRKKKRSRT